MEETKHHDTHASHPHVQEELVKIPVKLLVSIIVIIAILVLAFFVIKSGIISGVGGNGTISEKEATSKLLNFFSTQVPDSNVTFVSVSAQGSLYEITLDLDGQETPVFVTSDGKYIITDMIPLE
jgi:hypothetical protein